MNNLFEIILGKYTLARSGFPRKVAAERNKPLCPRQIYQAMDICVKNAYKSSYISPVYF